MVTPVHIAFEATVLAVRLDDILPLRKLDRAIITSRKYRAVAASIGEVGVIEPLVIARQENDARYLLVDGHLRHFALSERGEAEAPCIVADDDEAFTYNKRVNRLATIQEHYMIRRAIDRGVPADKIARALGVDVAVINRRRTLLDDICPEVIDLLKHRRIDPATFEILKKLKPLRQVEAVELMLTANNLSQNYARALLAATRPSDLARPGKPKQIKGLTAQQMARMEREMAALASEVHATEEEYGETMLHLVLAARYLERLLTKGPITNFLERHQPEMLDEFRRIIGSTTLDDPR